VGGFHGSALIPNRQQRELAQFSQCDAQIGLRHEMRLKPLRRPVAATPFQRGTSPRQVSRAGTRGLPNRSTPAWRFPHALR